MAFLSSSADRGWNASSSLRDIWLRWGGEAKARSGVHIRTDHHDNSARWRRETRGAASKVVKTKIVTGWVLIPASWFMFVRMHILRKGISGYSLGCAAGSSKWFHIVPSFQARESVKSQSDHYYFHMMVILTIRNTVSTCIRNTALTLQ